MSKCLEINEESIGTHNERWKFKIIMLRSHIHAKSDTSISVKQTATMTD